MANKSKKKKVLIRIQNLKQYFSVKKASVFSNEKLFVRANEDITLDIYEGETFGLVGESGCGKSTLGRSLLQLYEQTDGRTLYYGRNIYEINPGYVENILEKLEVERKKVENLKTKEEAAFEKYKKLPDGDEKYIALEEYRAIEKEERNLFLDVVELIGGLYVADDLKEVSNAMLKNHRLRVK